MSSHGLNDPLFATHLQKIAQNCCHLKSIALTFLLDPYPGTTNAELLSPLRQFKELKRLALMLHFHNNTFEKSDKENIESFSFKAFEGFKDLTHLNFYPIMHFKETILTDIDINLPNIQKLVIRRPFKASKWTAHILSQLSHLESIDMDIENESIHRLIETEITENCKRIRKICCNFSKKPKPKTIFGVINKYFNNLFPKLKFSFRN